jgi:hypothetical protein
MLKPLTPPQLIKNLRFAALRLDISGAAGGKIAI